MKKFCLLVLFLLLNFPVNAQATDALLLFEKRGNDATTGIYVLNADTGEERLMTDSYVDAGWSPDGRVWVVDDDDEGRRLRFFDAQSGAESTFEERLYPDDCFASLLWSPHGKQLAYFTGEGDERVLKMLNLADGSRYQMPVTPYEMPRWSSDENYVLINEAILSSPFRLLAASDGTEILNNIEDAVFSPDSRYLAYADAGETMWVYSVASGEARNLAIQKSYPIPVWSPGGRYVLFDVYPSAESLDYYDVESGSLGSIDLGYPVGFARWAADETSILLHADYADYSGDQRPTTFLSYDLASGQSTRILADTGWIGSIYRNGDWTAVRYSLTPLEKRDSPTTHVLVYNGETRIDFELLVGDGWILGPSIVNLEDGFLIAARDGLYRFDSGNTRPEAIYSGNTSYPFRSADGDYLAFLSMNEGGFFYNLNVWNTASETMSTLLEEDNQVWIIGWRGSSLRNSLLYCGVG